jgi:hypothetical protein
MNEQSRWWKVTVDTVKECLELSQGNYLVGCPDLIENIDILASLRDAETMLMDMIDRPEWIDQKIKEITAAWFRAYQKIYDLIKLPDQSSAFCAFSLWGPGKTAKLQCDAAAMISTEMFDRFVAPSLTEQCDWLDHSMYHLDGTQAMHTLDRLLAIESLDAIEWTPQAGIEGGGKSRWFDMYKKILGAGKSLQVVDIEVHEIIPLFNEIGGKGVYVLPDFTDMAQAEDLYKKTEQFR